MAIYSLNLKSIGRTTHAAGTAGAHLLYIAREGASPELVAAHMPLDPNDARAWMNQAETGDRKNARVIDKGIARDAPVVSQRVPTTCNSLLDTSSTGSALTRSPLDSRSVSHRA